MARLRHPNGSVVVVPDEKVENLVRNGFTAEEKATKKATRRRAASDESEK